MSFAIYSSAGLSVFDVNNEFALKTLISSPNKIESFEFSCSGGKLATIDDVARVILWNINDHTNDGSSDFIELDSGELEDDESVMLSGGKYLLRFNHFETLLASCAQTDEIKLWDLRDNIHIFSIKHDRVIRDIRFSADDCQIVTCSQDRVVKVWSYDRDTSNIVESMCIHCRCTNAHDATAEVDAEDGEAMILSPFGERFACSPSKGDVFIWNLSLTSSNREVQVPFAELDSEVSCSPEHKCDGNHNSPVSAKRKLPTLHDELSRPFHCHIDTQRHIQCLLFSENSDTIYTVEHSNLFHKVDVTHTTYENLDVTMADTRFQWAAFDPYFTRLAVARSYKHDGAAAGVSSGKDGGRDSIEMKERWGQLGVDIYDTTTKNVIKHINCEGTTVYRMKYSPAVVTGIM